MDSLEAQNISVVRRYFDACNTGDLAELQSTLADDVVHYFLPDSFRTIRGAEHLAKFWRKYKLSLNPVWRIDNIIAQGNRVVNEWSCLWSPSGTTRRIMSRGTEWYLLSNGRISEVRAYFVADEANDSELRDFPYSQRGYLTHSLSS